jgi:hypothetical protein
MQEEKRHMKTALDREEVIMGMLAVEQAMVVKEDTASPVVLFMAKEEKVMTL